MLSALRHVLAAALALSWVAAIPTITTKGSKFFTSDGDQFFIKGIAYQLSEADPLLDGNQCSTDAMLMSTLGANVIRVYHVTQGDHSACMTAFSNAGIYLFVDLDTFDTQIDQDNPYWNSTQESAFEAVMDEFHSYDNTAGFFVGNEVVTQGNHSEAIVYVKAAARDMKAYRASKGYRDIPIGYSAADISELRPNLQNYLVCGSNASENVDFFGLNAYEWCGDSSYTSSGYDTLTQQVMQYPVPIFFSEDGCNSPEPRTFQDQLAIFGPQMAPYWSGAIIYEWIEETNMFGLVSYGGMTDALSSIPATASIVRSGSPTPVSPDFTNLKSVWASATPSSVSEAAYSPSLTAPPCPAYTSGLWQVNGDVALPSVGATLDAAAQSSIASGGGTSTAAASGGSAGATGSSSATKGAAASVPRAPAAEGIVAGLFGLVFSVLSWL